MKKKRNKIILFKIENLEEQNSPHKILFSDLKTRILVLIYNIHFFNIPFPAFPLVFSQKKFSLKFYFFSKLEEKKNRWLWDLKLCFAPFLPHSERGSHKWAFSFWFHVKKAKYIDSKSTMSQLTLEQLSPKFEHNSGLGSKFKSLSLKMSTKKNQSIFIVFI